jgi:tetratricopeptide (TPR) repeat protein
MHRKFVNVALLLFGLQAFFAFSSAGASERIDNIPMYGQPETARPDFLKKADEEFMQEAVTRFGTRENASKAWFAVAEEFMQKGDLDLAMRRYNQSWLLNPNNYQPYWGFGRVMLQQDKLAEAIKYLEKSKQLVDDQFQKVALLSDLGTAYSYSAQHASSSSNEKNRLFKLANQNYSEATTLDPTYGNGWRRWAMSLYEEGDYPGAWDKVKKARAQNARPLPPAFLRALEDKLPEPQ